MFNPAVVDFVSLIDQFINRQLSSTHPTVIAETELLTSWRRQLAQLTLTREAWQEKTLELIKVGHAVFFLLEVLREQLNAELIQALKRVLYLLTDDIHHYREIKKIKITSPYYNVFEKILTESLSPKLKEETVYYLGLSEERNQDGLSIGAAYKPVFQRLAELRLSSENQINKNNKNKEKELNHSASVKMNIQKLALLEKLLQAKYDIFCYINNRLCRKSIFHHPELHLTLLADYSKLSIAINKLDSLTRSKINSAINLLDQLADLETEIIQDENQSSRGIRAYEKKANTIFTEAIQTNRLLEAKKIWPYLPGMSSGYEKVLKRIRITSS